LTDSEIEPPRMTTVSLITPSYSRDVERCSLLCESVDRHVSGYDRHYVIVHDEDVALFSALASRRRVINPVSRYLPRWLRQMPFGIRVRGRILWLSLRAPPVQGWHVQQLVKLQATASLPLDIAVHLDSDTVFVRDFDVAVWAGAKETPFLSEPGGIVAELEGHPKWLATAHQLLGLEPPRLPADDHIGHVIAWRQDATKSLLARIERQSGQHWVRALCRNRHFSEYILYGRHVETTPELQNTHRRTDSRICRSHWDDAELDAAGLARLVAELAPHQVAIAIQSFGSTSVDVIRQSLGQRQSPAA
jgi:hypothetical protein